MKKKVFSQINVTPFVDVMLVLLVIFMAVSPFIQQSIDIDLPKALLKEKKDAESKALVISISKEGIVYIDNKRIIAKNMADEFSKYLGQYDVVVIKGDKSSSYEPIAKAIAAVKTIGFTKIHLAVDQE